MSEEASTQTVTENATNKLNGLIDSLSTFAENAGSFATEQTPLVIQEFLTYNFYKSAIFATVLFLISIPLWYVAYRIGRLVKESHNADLTDDIAPLLFMGAVVTLIAVGLDVSMGSQILECIQITVAPRLYIIEQVAELVGKANGNK